MSEAIGAAEEAAQALRYQMQRTLLQAKDAERTILLLKENRRLSREFGFGSGYLPLVSFLQEDERLLLSEVEAAIMGMEKAAPGEAEKLRAKLREIYR